jgi:hypothetical protein
MALDARYRDKGGEISRKRGNTLIGALRISYGSGFAKGCANEDKLTDVLASGMNRQPSFPGLSALRDSSRPCRVRNRHRHHQSWNSDDFSRAHARVRKQVSVRGSALRRWRGALG